MSLRRKNIRGRILSIYELGKMALLLLPGQTFRKINVLIDYAHYNPGHGRRKVPLVNIDEIVKKWVDTVYGITFSHSKDELDKWEFTINEMLTPILTAPIKEVREFYVRLVAGLKADERIPWVVWRMFEGFGSEILSKAKDEEVIELKAKLAMEIAKLAEEEIKPQIAEAMANALMWRDPPALRRIKKALVKGEKPKLKGRESCLFMEVGNETIQL